MLKTSFVTVENVKSKIPSILDYSDLGGCGLNIQFSNGLQLSIVEGSDVTLTFELTIYNFDRVISPEYFGVDGLVVDVLRGCDFEEVNYSIEKVANTPFPPYVRRIISAGHHLG